MDLCNSIARIVCIVRTGPILKRRLRASIQRIVRVGRGLTLSVEHRGEIAIVVIGRGLGSEQRISSRDRPIHIIGRVDRLLALRIGDGEQIAIGIVAELRDTVDGIGEQGDPVQRIRRIDRFLTQGIDDAAQSSRRIQHALGVRASEENAGRDPTVIFPFVFLGNRPF